MYVCMCVCLFVCLFVCLYVCMFVCLFVCLFVCTFVCMFICLFYLDMQYMKEVYAWAAVLHSVHISRYLSLGQRRWSLEWWWRDFLHSLFFPRKWKLSFGTGRWLSDRWVWHCRQLHLLENAVRWEMGGGIKICQSLQYLTSIIFWCVCK